MSIFQDIFSIVMNPSWTHDIIGLYDQASINLEKRSKFTSPQYSNITSNIIQYRCTYIDILPLEFWNLYLYLRAIGYGTSCELQWTINKFTTDIKESSHLEWLMCELQNLLIIFVWCQSTINCRLCLLDIGTKINSLVSKFWG